MKHVVRGTKKKSSAPKKIDENYDDSEKIIDQTSIKVKLNRLVRAVDPSNPDHDQSFIDQRTSLLRLIEECVVFGSHSIIQACEVMQRVIITYCTCNSDRYDNEDLGSMIQKSKIYVQSLNAHYVRPRGRGGAVEQPLQIITDVREEYFPIDNIPFADLPNNSLRARIFATLASTMETNFLNHYTLNFYVYQGYLIKAFLCRMRGRAKPSFIRLIRDKINGKNVDIGDNSPAIEEFIDGQRALLGFASMQEERDGHPVIPVNETFIDPNSPQEDDNTKWIKKNLTKVIKYFYKITRRLEDEVFGKKARICPIYRYGIHHIRINNNTLYWILREIGFLSTTTKEKTWLHSPESLDHWKVFFDVEQFEKNTETTSLVFDRTLTTDGVSVSPLFDREKAIRHSSIPTDIDEFREYINQPANICKFLFFCMYLYIYDMYNI